MATDPVTSLPDTVVSVCSQVAVAAMPWLAVGLVAVLVGVWCIRALRGFEDGE